MEHAVLDLVTVNLTGSDGLGMRRVKARKSRASTRLIGAGLFKRALKLTVPEKQVSQHSLALPAQ
jgi:hypothetical protein